MRIAARVREILEAAGIPYALIGAVAMAARGRVRATLDTDYLVTDRKAMSAGLWSELQSSGVSVDIRRGDMTDPLAGVVRVHLGAEEVDVVVGKYKWQAEIISRAERMDVDRAMVPVPTIADLIILKLYAGGYQDLADVSALLTIGDRDATVREVTERIASAGKDASRVWKKIVSGGS